MLRLCFSLFLGVLLAPSLPAEKPTEDGIQVVSDLVLLDLEKFQELSFRIYHPTREGRYPAIIFSHRRGEDQTSREDLTHYWASHGYVCITPSHQDPQSFQSETQEELKNALVLQSIHKRVDDIRFILDSIQDIDSSILPPAVKIDSSRIGLAGEDWGAQVAHLLGGAVLYQSKSDTPVSFLDKRIRAFLVVDPPLETSPFCAQEDSWNSFYRPLMVVGGPYPRPESKKQAQASFYQSPRGNKSLLWIEKTEGSFFPYGESKNESPFQGLSFQNTPSELTPDLFPLKAQSTLTFWEAFLRGNPQHKQILQRGLPDSIHSQSASLQFRE